MAPDLECCQFNREEAQLNTYRILILGASYGSLLAAKLLFAGHSVHLICSPPTAVLINQVGIRVLMPLKTGRAVEIDSQTLPGRLTASDPGGARPEDFDLVVLAMQEPQYSAPGVRDLVEAVAQTSRPCMSLMNMPPLPYLKRVFTLDVHPLRRAYTEPSLWDSFDPGLMTLCSPDPQAFRPPGSEGNVLQVTLPTNFKAARFDDPALTGMIRQLQADIDAIRFETADGAVDLPVKLKVYDSLFVPLAKWPMLLAGNYRCVTEGDPRTISEAIWSDIDAARDIYCWTSDLCTMLGSAHDDLVPFEKYASAARGLSRPSSVARALAEGGQHIERVDRLVQLVATGAGKCNESLTRIVELIDAKLAANAM